MPRVCLRCENSFKNYGSLRIGFNHCPISDCIGEVVDIDDMIYQTIVVLNKNGYKTKYSCSGHVNEAQPRIYVIFERGVHFEESFLHLLHKEGFSVEANDTEDTMIYKDFDDETSQDQKYINLMDYNMKLFLLVQAYPWSKI